MGGGISALTRKSKEAEPPSAHGRLHPVTSQPSGEAQSAVCMHACIWTARQRARLTRCAGREIHATRVQQIQPITRRRHHLKRKAPSL